MSRATPHLGAEPRCNEILLEGPGPLPHPQGTTTPRHPRLRPTVRRLRDAYITTHPTCEICHRQPAIDVHHTNDAGQAIDCNRRRNVG